MKKKILFLCYENEIYHVLSVAKEFDKKKFQLFFFCTDYFSTIAGNDYVVNSIKSAGHDPSNIFSIKKEILTLNKFKENQKIKIDWNFLKHYEVFFDKPNLVNNLYKDWSINNIYNPRDHNYSPINKDIYFKFLELVCKKIDKVTSIKFDCIYSPNISGYCRTLISDIAKKKKISFFTLIERFYKKTFLIDNSSERIPYYFGKKIKNFNYEKNYKNKYKNLINSYQNKVNIFDNHKAYTFRVLFFSIIFILKKNFRFLYIINNKHKYKHGSDSRPFYFFCKSIYFQQYSYIRDCFRKFFIYKLSNKNLKEKIKIIKKYSYVYMPLHIVPEAGAFTKNEFFDEYYLIQRVSKVLPVNFKIVVKINPYTIVPFVEQSKLEHYKKISEIPNVVLVGPNINNIFLLKNSKAVITVCGSSSLESLFFNKAGFLFSKTEFSYLENIYIFNENTFYLDLIRNFKQKSKNFKNFLINVLKFGFDDVINNIIYADPKLSISDKYKKNISKKIFSIINYHFN
jgi:hypothetical protein